MDRSLLRLAIVSLGLLSAPPSVVADEVTASRPLAPAASREAIFRDWVLQDYNAIRLPPELERERQSWRAEHLAAPEAAAEGAVLERPRCFQSGRDSVVEQRLVARALEECGSGSAESRALAREAAALLRAGAPGADPRWRELYTRAAERRRARRLEPLLRRWRRFVFNEHRHIRASWKYTEMLSDARSESHRHFRPGARLAILELEGIYGRARPLIEDSGGMIRNPDVSPDGERVLFAWKRSDRGDDFHLWEMEARTGAVRQITRGLGHADFEGVYLPDGGILFSSTRCEQSVPCNWVEVSNLYRTDPAGRRLQRLGFDQVHTVFPSVGDDGLVLYTRWEYSDRAQMYPQPLFQMNPDGTGQRELYGNSSWFPTNIIHARKIPGSRRVLAVITGHHRPAHGKLAIIDPAAGREEGRGVRLVAPERPARYARVDRYALAGEQFQYPYPIDERHFLVSLALPAPRGGLGRFDLYLMDTEGRRELLVEGGEAGEDGFGCKQIVPLAPRAPPHRRPSQVAGERDTGTFLVRDAHSGPGLEGVPRGTVKRLRVVALRFRAAAIGRARQSGRGGDSEVTTPIAIANGSWDVKVVLGSVPVAADGSAFFEAPARTPLYFQALDEKGRVVQTMRSWTTLMPGERQSCAGCHDDGERAPPPGGEPPLALAAGPRRLEPFYGPPRGFSFPREIQPILDRRCIRCHDGEKAPPDLTAAPVLMKDMKRRFSASYLSLTHAKGPRGDPGHPMVNWIDSMSEPTPLPPYHRGSATSGLLALLEGGHEGVELSRRELDELACWIDLLVPYCGDYLEANAWSPGDLARYARYAAKRERARAEETGDGRPPPPLAVDSGAGS